MPWFKLTGDERITQRCATENCGGSPTERLEADGVGSNYCSGCRAQIEATARQKTFSEVYDENARRRRQYED